MQTPNRVWWAQNTKRVNAIDIPSLHVPDTADAIK